jgi:MFS family permease
MAPASLISMFVAPVAGRMTGKIGGKFILMSGLILFGAGMGWIALIARPGASWPVFVAPLIVAGLGMGCIFAPMVTVAMHGIEPRMAGAASGVLNSATGWWGGAALRLGHGHLVHLHPAGPPPAA